MKRPRKLVRHLWGLILALAGLMSVAGPVLERAALAQSSEVAIRWTFTGSLTTNRWGHTATVLPDGKVLVAGGGGFPCDGGGFCYSTVNASAELYDPVAGTWSFTGSLSRRAGHSATLLQGGQVLVVAGDNWGYDIGRFEYVDTAELYDPATEKWRATQSPIAIRGYNHAELLPNGKVLVVGSHDPNGHPLVPIAELYEPAAETWSSTGSPTMLGSLTLLPNGKVLAVSGNHGELYDPVTARWTNTDDLNVILSAVTVTLLQSGKVLVTGDGDNPSAELYDPETGRWSITGSPFAARGTATLLPDGRVLLAGGYDSQHPVDGEEVYDPATETWSYTARLLRARSGHTATLLPGGRVLVAGGIDGDGDIGTVFLDSAELYGTFAIPKIIGATVAGKRLIVIGENFDEGAVVLLNGEEQATANDDQNPRTTLIAKKAGRKIKPGDSLQVRNADGALSEEFAFTGA